MKMAKKALKALLPSLRERKRYLVFKLISKTDIKDFNAVKTEIKDSLKNLIGDLGMAKADIRFIKEKNNKGVIMINHTFLDHLRAGLALVEKVKEVPVIICSIAASGTVKKAQSYME